MPSLNHLKVWRSLAEAKVFNPNIAKLDTKIVSCHFIGYLEKSKGYRFYCPDKYTKFVETRHAVFLDDEMMRGSMVARKIDLEEKRVHAPNPMTQEPFFALPCASAPIIPSVVVQAPVVTPPMTTMSENSEPIRQESNEPFIEHEREQQQPPPEAEPQVEEQNVPENEAPRRSTRARKAISTDYKVYNTETVHMEGDPTSYEEAMRSPDLSKWVEAMEDEMRSMSANNVWDLENIPK